MSKVVKKDGKPIGVLIDNKQGTQWLKLNPSGRARKFATELKSNVKMTNEGQIKKGAGGSPIKLDKAEASYRMGYLAARSDNAKAYKSNQKKHGNSAKV